MEIIWRNPNKLNDWEVYLFCIGYLEEGDHVQVYYLSSWRHFEVFVNLRKAGFCGKGLNLAPQA
jgi:hypothetical protein